MTRMTIDSRVTYFDPNTYGVAGYSLIGPLLLFFDKVVLYGPVAYLIDQCHRDSEYRATSMTIGEFVKCISAGMIIPIAFETFFDADARQELSPIMRVTDSFDRDLISPDSALGKRSVWVPSNFKNEISPQLAREIVDGDFIIRNRLTARLEKLDQVPSRYIDLVSNDAIPANLREMMPDRSAKELLPYVTVYDLLNNQYVMAHHGKASLHSQHVEFKDIYHSIHGLESHVSNPATGDGLGRISTDEIAALVNEAVSLTTKKISYGRLTLHEIVAFREHHRNAFVDVVERLMRQIAVEDDMDTRREIFVETLESRLSIIRDKLNLNPIHIAEAVLSKWTGLSLLSKPITNLLYGKPGTIRNKSYHLLRNSLLPGDRWAYQFLKSRR